MNANFVCLHPNVTVAVRSVMARFGELANWIRYPDHDQLEFRCGDDPDLKAIDAALDSSEACNGYRGYWTP